MLFAIPSRESSFSHHFAKAPQILLWDSQTNTRQTLAVPPSATCCSRKHYWQDLLRNNPVDAVIVGRIGSAMLNTLFKLNVQVLSAPRGFDPGACDVSQLTPVTDLAFAHPSVKKHKTCDSPCSQRRDASADTVKTAPPLQVKRLSPRAMNHLTKIFKLNP